MGKKTKQEKRMIQDDLDILKFIREDIIARNPRIRALQEQYPMLGIIHDNKMLQSYYSEFERIAKETYGENFPAVPYLPVQTVVDEVYRKLSSYKPRSELVLKIDLSYPKYEIMHVLEQFIKLSTHRYRESLLTEDERIRAFVNGSIGRRFRKGVLRKKEIKRRNEGTEYQAVQVLDASSVPNVTKDASFDTQLFLKVDLNCPTDLAMKVVKEIVAQAPKDNIHNKLSSGSNKKRVLKWIQYLKVWDLKSGSPQWYVEDGERHFIAEEKRRKPWTYEQIAKRLYPDEQSPKELKRAIDRVKKQYWAASKLICGKTYNSENVRSKIEDLNRKGGDFPCGHCKDRHCNTQEKPFYACPLVQKYLANMEVKQQHLLVSNPADKELERFNKEGKRLPRADDCFK